MSRYAMRGFDAAMRAVNLLWTMAAEDSAYDAKIQASACAMLLEIYRLYAMKVERRPAIERCVATLAKGQISLLLPSIRVMRAVLGYFPITFASHEPLTRSRVIAGQ